MAFEGKKDKQLREQLRAILDKARFIRERNEVTPEQVRAVSDAADDIARIVVDILVEN